MCLEKGFIVIKGSALYIIVGFDELRICERDSCKYINEKSILKIAVHKKDTEIERPYTLKW